MAQSLAQKMDYLAQKHEKTALFLPSYFFFTFPFICFRPFAAFLFFNPYQLAKVFLSSLFPLSSINPTTAGQLAKAFFLSLSSFQAWRSNPRPNQTELQSHSFFFLTSISLYYIKKQTLIYKKKKFIITKYARAWVSETRAKSVISFVV